MRVEIDLHCDLEITENGLISVRLSNENDAQIDYKVYCISDLIEQQVDYYRVPVSNRISDRDGDLLETLDNLDAQLRGASLLLEVFRQELKDTKLTKQTKGERK